jgi:hypothetical protein
MIAGSAGLGYVVAASVENMEALGAPLLGAGAEAIRAAHADQALGIVTTVAGAVALAFYLVFAFALRRSWAPAAVFGVTLAAIGLAANAALVAGDDRAVDLSELALRTRFAAGAFMALFLVGAARSLPISLRRLAWLIAVPLALAPLALTGVYALQVGAGIAFGAHALWIWLASLWLLFGGVAPAELARRAAFLMLVLAAGAVGVALLAVPDATGSFFAWTLKPAPLAAFAGGVYVGSAAVYAAGIGASWHMARPLVLAAVVLSVSVLAVTLAHLEIFDLHRLQAWAWLALFAGFALVTIVLALRREPGRAAGVPLPVAARATFAAAAIALGVAGVALWADPAAFGLPPLGGRFAGSWTVMLAVLAAWPAIRNRRDEARLPALALVALPAGALLAAARSGAGDPAYIAALALLALTGLALAQRGTGWRGSYSPSGPKPGTSMLASTPQP